MFSLFRRCPLDQGLESAVPLSGEFSGLPSGSRALPSPSGKEGRASTRGWAQSQIKLGQGRKCGGPKARWD